MSILLSILGIYVLGMFMVGLPMGIWSLKIWKRKFWEKPTRSFLLNLTLFPCTTCSRIAAAEQWGPSLPFIEGYGTPWSDEEKDVLNRGRYLTLTMIWWRGACCGILFSRRFVLSSWVASSCVKLSPH